MVAAQPIDIGVVSIDSPSGTGSFGVSEGVTVTVKNFGVQNVSNFVLQLAADDKFLGNQSFFVSLMPGQEASVVFSTTVDLSGPGEHTIFARTTVAGDGDPTNDIATATVTTSNCLTSKISRLGPLVGRALLLPTLALSTTGSSELPTAILLLERRAVLTPG